MAEDRSVRLDPEASDFDPEEFRTGPNIGVGGMGVVREAEDERLLRSVAVKFLRKGRDADAYSRRRLVAEAQLTAQLDHPNIVPVYRLGVERTQGLYFSMKKVEGRTLTELLRGMPLSRRSSGELYDLLQIFLKVCDAVAFAHSRGVLHRDIKADNVMVGRFGQVYLMDWGIAARVGHGSDVSGGAGESAAGPKLTRNGMVVGTLNYMAPEQITGGKLDERTDVFALGGLLYEMLTTQPPYPDGPEAQLVEKVRRCRIIDPSKCVEASLPSRLCSICMRALAAKPDDRYASVEKLQEDLTAFLRSGWQFPVRRFPAGAVVFREGDPGQTAYAIYSGHCRVLQGPSREEIRVMGPGEVFGETAVFAETRRTATVEAVDDAVLLEVSRESFEEELGMGFWMGLFVKALARRFVEKDEELRRIRESGKERVPEAEG